MKRSRPRLKIIVTCGATREPLDAVRFISNYATGYFGRQIARIAKARGHRVIVVSTTAAPAEIKGVRTVKVQTARQMQAALAARFSWCDCLIMTAGVGDFRVKNPGRKKLRRAGHQELRLCLLRNPDILAKLGRDKGRRMLVGCALETESLKQHARRKLQQKNLDLIVATQMKSNSYPFGPVRLNAIILDRKGRCQKIGRLSKTALAGILLDRIERSVARWPRS